MKLQRKTTWGRKVLTMIWVAGLSVCSAQDDGTISLPEPDLDQPLMRILKKRQSNRSFGAEELTRQQISELLWAGFGINRPDAGKRTAPTAMNTQNIDLYVALPEGTFRYDAEKNLLVQINDKDIRSLTGEQGFVKDAAVNVVMVADYTKSNAKAKDEQRFYAAANSGFISQNMYLYCATNGLATVVRAYIDKEKLSEALGLAKTQEVIFAQSVGHQKK
jgi:SagB-type dehydrogenase family enzyme